MMLMMMTQTHSGKMRNGGGGHTTDRFLLSWLLRTPKKQPLTLPICRLTFLLLKFSFPFPVQLAAMLSVRFFACSLLFSSSLGLMRQFVFIHSSFHHFHSDNQQQQLPMEKRQLKEREQCCYFVLAVFTFDRS